MRKSVEENKLIKRLVRLVNLWFRADIRILTRANGYTRSENVGGLHELQGCELRGDDAAVELDFRWWDRNRVLRLSKLLHHHQKGTGTRQSVVRVWESDRQLAGAGESCQTLTRYVNSYSMI